MHPNAHAYTRLNRNVCFLGLLIGLASLQVSQKLIFCHRLPEITNFVIRLVIVIFLGYIDLNVYLRA